MSITELAIHNVLRTYSRQDRLGKLQRPGASSLSSSADKLDLSTKAQKLSVVSRTADELVARANPASQPEEREGLVRSQIGDLINKHRAQIEDRSLTPDAMETALRALYLS